MRVILTKPTQPIEGIVKLPGSKSISNRVLIIKKLLQNNSFQIQNLSNCNDTLELQKALIKLNSQSYINCGSGGTTFRFLTVLITYLNKAVILSGSPQMNARPVHKLISALNLLGANITYLSHKNHPPIQINPSIINGKKTLIDGSVSSQFISALLLIAPYLKNGLEVNIKNKIVSKKYIELTINIMKQFGAQVTCKNKLIIVKPKLYQIIDKTYKVESDWSSASFYYGLIALSKINTSIALKGLYYNSFQPDINCISLFKHLGVSTIFTKNETILIKTAKPKITHFDFDFLNCPDLLQITVSACVALQVSFKFTGLQTLKNKETNRLQALQTEFKKCHINLNITKNSIAYDGLQKAKSTKSIFQTYQDHRMAMSLAILSIKWKRIKIENPEVVAKSYPKFWKDLNSIGIKTVFSTA